MTLLIATHVMEDVAALADRVVILDAGRVAAQGTPRQLFAQPDLMVAHSLEVPEIAALMQRLSEGRWEIPRAVFTVKEALRMLEPCMRLESDG
jgi:ABC-type multidrug transport system ATPase subunit